MWSLFYKDGWNNPSLLQRPTTPEDQHSPQHSLGCSLPPIQSRPFSSFTLRPMGIYSWLQTKQSPFLWRLLHSDIFFPTICTVGWLPPDRHVLWPVCCYLSPTALHSHHERPAVCTAGSGVLDDRCPEFLVTNFTGPAPVFLYSLGNPPLLLWIQRGDPTCLFWHLSK